MKQVYRNTATGRLSYYLSVILHPALMPTFVFWLMMYQLDPLVIVSSQSRLALLGLIFFGTFVVPTLMLFLLLRAGMIESMSLQHRHERFIPFLITTIFYAFLAFLFFKRVYFDRLLGFVLLGVTVSMFFAAVITRFYKISMHSIGMGGVAGVLMALQLHYGQWFDLRAVLLPVLVFSGLLMSARLYLRAHTPGQVWSGWLLSFSINFTALQLYFLALA